MRRHVPILVVASVAMGCAPYNPQASAPEQLRLVSQERIAYDGKLEDSQLPVSIVPAPGWTKRESKDFLSVVSQNGNVLNLGPAYAGISGSACDPEEETKGWLKGGKVHGGDIWDSRSFVANGRPGSYVIHISTNSVEYQSPAGDISGSIGGDVRLGFNGAFHPGATDFREITQMLESVRVERR